MDNFVAALLITASQVIAIALFARLFLWPRKRGIISYAGFLLFSFVCSWLYLQSNLILQSAIVFPVLSSGYFFSGAIEQKLFVAGLFLQLGFIVSALPGYAVGFFLLFLLAISLWRRDKPRLLQRIGIKHFLLWGLTTLNLIGLFLLTFSSHHLAGVVSIITAALGVVYTFSFDLERNIQLSEESKLVAKQLEFQQAKVRQTSSYLQIARRAVHNMKRQYRKIDEALAKEQLEQAKSSLKEINAELDFPELLEFTGNDRIDSLLYSLQMNCQQADIQLKQQLVIQKRVLLDEALLASLLGNLFDHVMTVAKQNKVKKLSLTMKTSAQFLLIEVSYPEEKRRSKLLSRVTSEIPAEIVEIVEQVSGIYDTAYPKSECQIKVMLPLQRIGR